MLCGRSRVGAPDRTTTQGLKITGANVLPLLFAIISANG